VLQEEISSFPEVAMKKVYLAALCALLIAACGGANNAPAPARANAAPAANNASAEAPKDNPEPEKVALVYELGIEGMT
jgi:hypothetical protein